MKLRHKTTGDEFELDAIASSRDSIMRVWDNNGFMNYVKREFLEPVPVTEEWETVLRYDDIGLTRLGQLIVKVGYAWRSYPDEYLRFHEVNGVTVVQRRKA